ncbi:hypothetical protein BaRGS_00005681, partial [Batillaria attramentaria]
ENQNYALPVLVPHEGKSESMNGETRRSYGQAFTFKRKRAPGFQKGKKIYKKNNVSKVKAVDDEIAELKRRVADGVDSSKVSEFADFPLSKKTLDGLKGAKYSTPTEIQRESLMLALQGKDILGAAKTGSGKTLAFLIPVLEALHKAKWSQMDGMGALIISPTRELAYQTFEVLKKVGRHHDFSAGLVIGGKFLREEAAQINRTNIVICTPGRLLQHMDETYNFSADGLQILVLDEADRILDMGFAKTMNAIIANLPAERQTLLFSATQTKSVKDLARLSLHDPMYVSVHEHAAHSTPARLEQSYIVCELHEKLSMLWSFLKNHMHSKVLVFLTCCKQVKYVHEVMRRLRPGMTVLCLHGGMNQLKRVAVYEEFCRKEHVVLFATDIAAHFPSVNWVLQLDCPEDASTYIHRAGRTARFERDGEALLVLTPSEEEDMVLQLKERKIPINKIRVNPKRLFNISPKLEALCASDKTLKEMAQRAFVSYLRSVFLMKNKKVFNAHKLDTEAFSKSLGLAIPPRTRFLKRGEKSHEDDSEEDSEEETDKGSENGGGAAAALGMNSEDESDSDSGELFTVKRRLPPLSAEDVEKEASGKELAGEEMREGRKKPLTKAAAAKRLLKKNITANTRVVFDEEGNAVHDAAAKRMRLEDQHDKELHRQKIKQKHKEERIKKKERLRAERGLQPNKGAFGSDDDDEGEMEAVLDTPDDGTNPLDFIPDPDELAARGGVASVQGSKCRKHELFRYQQGQGLEAPIAFHNMQDDEEIALQLLKAGRNKR